MLWTVAVILLVLWALGMGTAYTGGGLVHLLLVIAAIVVVFQFLGAARPSDDASVRARSSAAVGRSEKHQQIPATRQRRVAGE